MRRRTPRGCKVLYQYFPEQTFRHRDDRKPSLSCSILRVCHFVYLENHMKLEKPLQIIIYVRKIILFKVLTFFAVHHGNQTLRVIICCHVFARFIPLQIFIESYWSFGSLQISHSYFCLRLIHLLRNHFHTLGIGNELRPQR